MKYKTDILFIIKTYILMPQIFDVIANEKLRVTKLMNWKAILKMLDR